MQRKLHDQLKYPQNKQDFKDSHLSGHYRLQVLQQYGNHILQPKL